jgi:hypothetical protein
MEMIEDCKRQILTIDVGVNGGICYQDKFGIIKCRKLKNEWVELSDQLSELIELDDPEEIEFYVEHQNLRKPDIVSGRWFNIHKLCIQYEMIKNCISSLGGKPISITPQEWQSIFFQKGTTYKDKKRKFKDLATKLFPELKVTLWNSDALLMLYYKNKLKDGKIRRTRRLNR